MTQRAISDLRGREEVSQQRGKAWKLARTQGTNERQLERSSKELVSPEGSFAQGRGQRLKYPTVMSLQDLILA